MIIEMDNMEVHARYLGVIFLNQPPRPNEYYLQLMNIELHFETQNYGLCDWRKFLAN